MQKIKEKLKKIFTSDFFLNIILYTILFFVIFSFIISIFSKYGKWFVFNSDGFRLHTINLIYYRQLLVNFIRTGNFSTFVWNIGNGFDLFSNFSYTILGDFFSYLSIFVRTKDVPLLYNILIFLRIYCIGISFLFFAKYKKINKTPAIIGSLTYTFSSYVLYAGLRHPFFMNPLIIFPLLMVGIEKIIKEDKTIFYTLMIAIAFIVSFYFAYTMSCVLAIYGIILSITYYKKEGLNKVIKVLLKTLFYSLLGIMISAFILLPTGIQYINSQRFGGQIATTYSLTYYRKLMYSILHLKNSGYWVVIGTQSLILITLPLIIFKKNNKNKPIIILLLILFLPFLFAPLASALMGFGFPNNRWSYIISFLFAVINAFYLNEKFTIGKKELMIILTNLILFFIVNAFFENNLSRYFEIQILLLFVWLIILYNKDFLIGFMKKVNLYNICLIVLAIIGIGTSIKFIYDVDGSTYVSDFSNKDDFKEIMDTSYNNIPDFTKAVNYINDYDNSFYKIAKYPYDLQNISLIKKFNSTGYFESIVTSNLSNLNADLNNSDFELLTGFNEFDYRTKINTLLGVKYFINYDNGIIPYGYKKINNYKGKSKIYENELYLPFGTLYTNYITEDEYNNLNSLEKESCLLKTTALEDKNDLKHFENDYSKIVKEIQYELIDDNNIVNKENILITNAKKNSFELKIDKVENSEIYVSIKNLKFAPYTKEEIINLNINEESDLLDIADIKQEYKWYQPDASYRITAKFNKVENSRNEKDYITATYLENLTETLFNFGYYDEISGTIKITLSKIGKYTYDDIKIYAVSMDGYEEDVNNLKKSNFEVIDYDSGYLNGTVNAEENGILQFQTMYSEGWKVYVDNKEVETLKSNKYFLGINIDKGNHDIHLEYHTQYFKEGIVISIVGLGGFIGSIIYKNKKKKQKN